MKDLFLSLPDFWWLLVPWHSLVCNSIRPVSASVSTRCSSLCVSVSSQGILVRTPITGLPQIRSHSLIVECGLGHLFLEKQINPQHAPSTEKSSQVVLLVGWNSKHQCLESGKVYWSRRCPQRREKPYQCLRCVLIKYRVQASFMSKTLKRKGRGRLGKTHAASRIPLMISMPTCKNRAGVNKVES